MVSDHCTRFALLSRSGVTEGCHGEGVRQSNRNPRQKDLGNFCHFLGEVESLRN